MPDTTKPTYAAKVLGIQSRSPGLVYVALGVDGFGFDEAEPTARIVLPVDTALELAKALTTGAAAALGVSEEPEQKPPHAALTMSNMLTVSMMTMSLTELVNGLGALAAERPDFPARLATLERTVMAAGRNAVVEGASIDDEAVAMRNNISFLETVFASLRKRADPD